MACTSDHSDEHLRSRIEDTVRLCDKRGVPCFLGFLDLHEQSVAQQTLSSFVHGYAYSLYGGYEDAERRIVGIYPTYVTAAAVNFPLDIIAFRYRKQKKLTHRDVLGTLMSHGIRRDAIGDILCGEGLSVAFLRSEIVPYICEQVDRIGGEGVTIVVDYDGEIPYTVAYEEIRDTIASARLDSVIKALIRCSREQACALIRSGSVSVEHMVVETVSKSIEQGDTVSIRGCGRYVIDQIGPETKKGRLTLLAKRRL